MSLFTRIALTLLLVLPITGYVAGTLLAAEPAPANHSPIVLEPDATASSPSVVEPDASRTPTPSPTTSPSANPFGGSSPEELSPTPIAPDDDDYDDLDDDEEDEDEQDEKDD